jgi:hypothetical protein
MAALLDAEMLRSSCLTAQATLVKYGVPLAKVVASKPAVFFMRDLDLRLFSLRS